MKRHRPIVALSLWLLLVLPAAAQQEGMHWQTDLESAKTQAAQTGRLVVIHFWKNDCPPCLALEQNVFIQPGVSAAIESQFVPVKLNADENPATAVAFGITRVPTDIVITPDGQVVGKHISPQTPAGYVSELSRIATQHATRAGQSFAAAAERAPAPSGLTPPNWAAPNWSGTVPLGASPGGNMTSDRYAMAVPNVANGVVGGVPSSQAMAQSSAPKVGVAGSSTYPLNTNAAAVPVFNGPATQSAATPPQPTYAYGAPPLAGPQAVPPAQVANPYAVAPVGVASMATAAPGVAASAPPQAAPAGVAVGAPRQSIPSGPALPPEAPPL